MHNFTSKPLTRDFRPFHKLACIWIFICINAFGIWAMTAAHNSFWSGVQAKEYLTFAERLPQRDIRLPVEEYWTLPGGSEHQNAVLRACQDGLRKRGITDMEVIRFGCGILLSENERLDPLRYGDRGHAFGICQRYLGKGVYAKDFLAENPEWKTIETQLDYCNDRFVAAYKKYGNVFQATVQHNSPAAAARKKDACHISPCYFQRVKIASQKLSLL